MRRLSCPVCDHEVFFDSIACERCTSTLLYDLCGDAMVTPRQQDPAGHPCANADLVRCNWVAEGPGRLCASCVLTRTRPRDDDAEGMALWPTAEEAKRHLLRDLARLGFDVHDGERPLSFDLLSSVDANVTIGHADGVITIDLAEGDHSHRERVREQLAEPYRTMLGHFRHESGHYVEWRLVEGKDRIDDARRLFGDEREDYQAAIDRHYADGPPADWQEHFLSAYATMHPYEDFAECFAHLLHIHDTLETADAFGLATLPEHASARELILETWLPFAMAMNVVNRSLGRRDLYPFVLPDEVVEKIAFVDSLRMPSEG